MVTASGCANSSHPSEISRRLVASGLNAPKVLASQLEQGFLLLSDLGSQLYLATLNAIKLSRVGVQTFRFGRDWLR